MVSRGTEAAAVSTESEIVAGYTRILGDTQTDWNVGTHSYKDVLGQPTTDEATVIMVPIEAIITLN